MRDYILNKISTHINRLLLIKSLIKEKRKLQKTSRIGCFFFFFWEDGKKLIVDNVIKFMNEKNKKKRKRYSKKDSNDSHWNSNDQTIHNVEILGCKWLIRYSSQRVRQISKIKFKLNKKVFEMWWF